MKLIVKQKEIKLFGKVEQRKVLFVVYDSPTGYIEKPLLTYSKGKDNNYYTNYVLADNVSENVVFEIK